MLLFAFAASFPGCLGAKSHQTCLGTGISAATRALRMAPGFPVMPVMSSDAQQKSATGGAEPGAVTSRPRNVLGSELQCCCLSPRTGFYRDGWCQAEEQDLGRHTVCAIMTDDFLRFSAGRGNDLITPMPQYSFPGLKAGDKWCLCVLRWKEAFDAGVAPQVVLEACHEKTLEYVGLDDLRLHATGSEACSA